MYITRDGSFTFEIDADELAVGLRPSEHSPRNKKFLVDCIGAIGYEKSLQSLEDLNLSKINTAVITDAFPFPQIFVLPYITIVCGLKKIYEWDGSSLTLKYTAAVAAGIWSVTDSFDFAYLSNGNIVVIRDPGSKAYTLDTTGLPTAQAIVNFNNQVMVGAPDAKKLGASLTINASPFTVTLSQLGTGL
jgi:hypothetical protein